ncbi:hypothetical protein [Henriciella algicola]|uniref:Uncharacterized protein n=1 Tax=Henriciella algicola TaxID=1608422 RepID=A0A399RI95_9PROT|nr:hypothetical protein [Henriciella algicola]RIJ31018.1 hypothetical protein D1222_01745 [Henriciella algicola]
MDWFNELFDLAAVASTAGLGGGVISAIVVKAFSGAILKFLVRIFATAILTGIGFYYLLGFLGFEIVPRSEVAAAAPPPSPSVYARSESYLPGADDDAASSSPAPQEEESARRLVVSSPFRRGD